MFSFILHVYNFIIFFLVNMFKSKKPRDYKYFKLHFIEILNSKEHFLGADFIWLTLCFEKHFIVAYINFKKKYVLYLDNMSYENVENSPSWNLVVLVDNDFFCLNINFI